jgi:hypothetical protein
VIVFVVSFAGKILNISAFEQTITNFKMLPGHLSKPAAVLFLAGEIMVVILVTAGGMFGALQKMLLSLGFVLAGCLLLVFSIALISVLVRNIQTSCNCFGSSEKPASPFDVLRNVSFILCAAVGWVVLSVIGNKGDDLTLLEWGIALCGAAIFVAVWMNLRDIAQVFRSD